MGIPTLASESDLHVLLDIPYDDANGAAHAANERTLDVFAPADTTRPLPILIIVPGGPWPSASKQSVREEARALAARGLVTFAIDHRPALPPAPTEDLARAVAWVRSHAPEHGGDPASIGLLGVESGAHAVALLTTDDRYLEAEGIAPSSIAGAIGIGDGAYDLPAFVASRPSDDPLRASFGERGARLREWSPCHLLRTVAGASRRPPFLLLTTTADSSFPSRLRATGWPVAWQVGPMASAAGWSMFVPTIADFRGAPKPPPSIFEHEVDDDGWHHYRVFDIATPAWHRDVPIPSAPPFVRRLLQCRDLALDTERAELRFTTRDDISAELPERLDRIAKSTGLVPYADELRRRARDATSATPEAPWRPVLSVTIPGRRPVPLSLQATDDGALLEVHVEGDVELPGFARPSPNDGAGERRTFRLRRSTDDAAPFEWIEGQRFAYDPAAEPPRPAPIPDRLWLGADEWVDLDRVTNHCLANDRFALRHFVAGQLRHRDGESLYGQVRMWTLEHGGRWLVAVREDRDEGTLLVWALRR